MAGKLVARVAVEGVDLNNSSWVDNGETEIFASFTSTSTPTIVPFQVVPIDTSSQDSKPTANPIWRLQGAQVAITGATAQAAQSTLNFGIVVYHNFGTLGAQITNAGGNLTTLTVASPGLNAPMPSGQTFTLTNAAGTVQTWTTTAAVGRYALSIPVSSQTPTGTNAIGNAFIGFLGGPTNNGIQFGWLASGSGTPALYLNQSTTLPAVNANITAGGGNTTGDPYGPYTYLNQGDLLCYYAESAGSVTVQSGIIRLLIA
jgi:hypothetical protein